MGRERRPTAWAPPRTLAGAWVALRRAVLLSVGVPTARWRRRPDFVIVGAQRAGTTSLFHYLAAHPNVMPSIVKEVHFFDRQECWERGLDWYLGHFPLEGSLRRAAGAGRWKIVTGEATPAYMFHEAAAERLREHVPDARLLAILRDPVERAFSDWRRRQRHARGASLGFEEHTDRALAALARSGGAGDDPRTWRRGQGMSNLTRGLYAPQLRRLARLFSRERILVLRHEDLGVDPEAVVREATDFLGLPPFALPHYEAHNATPAAVMDDAIRARLERFYAPANAELYAMLGRDLGWSR